MIVSSGGEKRQMSREYCFYDLGIMCDYEDDCKGQGPDGSCNIEQKELIPHCSCCEKPIAQCKCGIYDGCQ